MKPPAMSVPRLAGFLVSSVVLCLVGIILGLSFYDRPTYAQTTVTLNDSTITVKSPFRTGMNIGCSNYYENCQIFGNLVGYSNPGMEPGTVRQIQDLGAAGTSTSFADYNQYSILPENYWTGGKFQIVESVSNGPENGCTGTIASNTGPNRAYFTEFSWDGNSLVTFTGANGFVAGVSVVTIAEVQNGPFLNGKRGKVT